MSKKVKFGIKFRGGYKVEVEADGDQQLWPVSLYQEEDTLSTTYHVWDGEVHGQLYGQLMNLVEAIIEDTKRQEAVKTLIRKELKALEAFLERRASPVNVSDEENR